MTRTAALSLVLALAAAAVPVGIEEAGAAAPEVRPVIGAEMPERFGADRDRDGRLDLPNSPRYVDGLGDARFPVVLDGSPSTAAMGLRDLPLFRYDWTVSGEALEEPLVAEDTGPVHSVALPEGDYTVTLTVSARLPWGSVRNRATGPLTVEDLLVVAIGDSYASGEGNPERPGPEPLWADGGDPAVEAAHTAAHRSTVGWPARVALALERRDPGSSVTFVSVAASGASIERGVLGAQPDVADRSQIDEVVRLVGDRPIDLLLVSVGGNDIGFSRIIEALVDADPLFDPICYRKDLENAWASAVDGDWSRTSGLAPGLPFGLECRTEYTGERHPLAGLAGLPGEFDRLAEAITRRLRVGRVVVTEYPDPTGGAGATCREIVGDVFGVFGFLEISRSEQEEGRRRVIEPLNSVVRDAAGRHGWTFAGGIAERFADGHGYCAGWPDYRPPGTEAAPAPERSEEWYRNPGADIVLLPTDDPGASWYRTAEQSVLLQGPDLPYRTSGTLHPNELGHAAIAGAVLESLGG